MVFAEQQSNYNLTSPIKKETNRISTDVRLSSGKQHTLVQIETLNKCQVYTDIFLLLSYF